MKISNSKKQLARIISENCGWREGAEWAVQDEIIAFFSGGKHEYIKCGMIWNSNGFDGNYVSGIEGINKIPNWNQTILSREEYLHLYPATDSDGWIEWSGGECPVGEDVVVEIKTRDGKIQLDQAYGWNWSHEKGSPVKDRQIIAYRINKPEQAKPEYCDSVMRSIPEPEIHSKNTALTQVDDIDVVESKPTIGQLASDYRNLLDFAQRKQQEADDAKADADARLKSLELAGEAIGLVVTPIAARMEPELVIADWRDLRVGDIVVITGSDNAGWKSFENQELDVRIDGDSCEDIYFGRWCMSDNTQWRFIRRP